jgi:hypothetical protein
MDHLQLLSPQRLARALGAFLASLLLTLASAPALAAGEVYSNSSSGVTFGSLDEACQYGGVQYGYCGAVYAGFSNGAHRWDCRTKPWAGDPTCVAVRQAILSSGCASPNVLDTVTGVCNPPACAEGQVRNSITNECQPPCHAAGTAGGSAYVSPWTDLPRAICRDGCKLNVGGTGHHIPWSNGTTLHVVNGLVHTGEFCSGDINGEGEGNGEDETYEGPDDPDPIKVTPEDDPPRCGPGQCPGEFNGVHMCVSCTDIASPEKPVTTYDRKTETTTTGTPPNQTTETKTTDTKATHDGSGTVTSTTTTSTTKTDANGTTTTEEGKTEKKESQESFCKENPTVAFCKNGKWGGGCDAFTCEGDAVQCAIAKEIHQRNCEAAKSNAYTDMTDAAQAGTDNASTYIQAQKDAAALDVNARFSQSLDPSPIAASCPSSRSVALPGGNSLEISFEKPCEIAGWLGHFVQAFAYLFAALIVLRNPT